MKARQAVGFAAGQIELVGELVDHHVVGGAGVRRLGLGRALRDVFPTDDHRPARHGLARERARHIVHDAGVVDEFAFDMEFARIDDHLGEIVEHRKPEVQHRQTGLGRDRRRDFIGQRQSARARERSARDEFARQRMQRLTFVVIERVEKRQAAQHLRPDVRVDGRSGALAEQAFDPTHAGSGACSCVDAVSAVVARRRERNSLDFGPW